MTKYPLEGKICLVTGGTSGIGEATARQLAQKGARVIIVGRSTYRIEAAKYRIREASGRGVESFRADLSSQRELRKVADAFNAHYPRLDVLVNNAGAVFMKRAVSADGIEMTMALNHLAYFMLTLLLLDKLRAAESPRVVNVSSGMHRTATFDWHNFPLERGYTGLKAYALSKLANIMFTYELSRRLQGHPPTVNALSPGGVRTRIGHNNGIFLALLMRIVGLTWDGPEEGAATNVYLASSPDVEGVSGKFFEDCTEVRSSNYSYNQHAAGKLWDISLRLSRLKGIVPPYLSTQ
jgi:NAD(P)-dependent dehydrogenase (short-subunit alcohol dehydrogenase family)